MKKIFLLSGAVSILFSVYFFAETYDIFRDIAERGFFETPKDDWLLPFFLLLTGIFFLFIYFKKPNKQTP